MFAVSEVRVVLLNGVKIVYELPIRRNRTFSTVAEVVEYKRRTLEKNRERIIKKWRKQHPDGPEPEMELLLHVTGKEFYAEPTGSMKIKL